MEKQSDTGRDTSRLILYKPYENEVHAVEGLGVLGRQPCVRVHARTHAEAALLLTNLTALTQDLSVNWKLALD